MSEEVSLKESLKNISEKLEELSKQKKVKEWKLPFFTKLGMGKGKKRRGYVVFMHIGGNKAVTFIKAPVEEGVAMVNGVPHYVRPEDVLIWKNKIPLVIQPGWAESPFSPDDHYKMTEENNDGSKGWKYIMNYMSKDMMGTKKNIPWGLLIFGGIAAIALGYYLINSGML